MKIRCLQSAADEGPGIIADWAGRRGWTIETTHLYRGDAPPVSADFLLLMGGPMNIYQDRDCPWLKATRRFIAEHLAARKPAVGICLGAQFLADALGARVTQNPVREVGWFPVKFSEEARTMLPFLPAQIDVLHWHGDTFALPPGATRLAASEGCENLGFLYGGRVLALQFHPEMTREIAAALVEQEGDELRPEKFVQAGGEILGRPDAAFAAPNKLLLDLLDAMFLAAR